MVSETEKTMGKAKSPCPLFFSPAGNRSRRLPAEISLVSIFQNQPFGADYPDLFFRR